MAGRPRGSTNTKTTTPTTPHARSGVAPRAAGVFWTGGHIYQAYKAQNIWGFDVLMPNGNTLSSLCPQAMDVLNAVFTPQTTMATSSLANRSIPRDTTNAIPIDGNQDRSQNGSSVVRRVRKRVSGSRTPVTSSSS